MERETKVQALYNFEGIVSCHHHSTFRTCGQAGYCLCSYYIMDQMPTAVQQKFLPVFITNFQDPDELSFQEGETLTVINQDDDDWWTAENKMGERGSIPVNYVQIVS